MPQGELTAGPGTPSGVNSVARPAPRFPAASVAVRLVTAGTEPSLNGWTSAGDTSLGAPWTRGPLIRSAPPAGHEYPH